MRLSAASVARAVERDGVVRLDGIFPRPLLKRIAARVMRLYASGGLRERVVRDIAGRTTSILPFDGPFLERSFCANPRLLAIVENLLGGTARWSSLEVVMAESGAAAQYQHVDAPLRLDRKGKRYKGDLSTLPPYALALAVPLVDVDEENGPTAVWPGSHKEGLKYPPPPRPRSGGATR
ncbi:MAG: phytanoyl-CoA dioxygenase family protein [Elusimicrobiota bacterium]|nr:MAG: phytanoyl-CoA dioxygenase family protein [Elusimicrobiota bacterium]